MKFSKLLAACGLALAMHAPVSAQSYGLPEGIQEGNILHCFDWPIKDVINSLPDIAEAGFGSVQLSPLQRPDIRVGSSWHDLYRPYDLAFKASSGMGSADDLKRLCSEAGKLGIKVIVDVVANHVDKTSGYHDPWWDSNGRVRWEGGINYGDRRSITHGQLGDYGDINSESAEVIARAKAYIQELKNMGVKGIRWDAAKHIGLPSEGCNFWKEMASVPGVWHYGEILNEVGPNNSLIKEYTQYMSVTDNRYGNSASQNGGIPYNYAGEWVGSQGVPGNKVVYWGESHDTYSNDEWSQNVDQAVIDRAWAANACRNGETALYFSRPNTRGFSNIKVGKGSEQFKKKHIAEVNKFRNAMVGKEDYFSQGNNCVSITRKDGGAVIVSKGSGQVSLPNGGGYCPAGTYTDRVSGGTFTVTASTISGNVGSSGIAVIYGEVSHDPSVTLSPNGGNFVNEVSVTLTARNAVSAWYQIGNGAQTSFAGTTTVKIGSGMSVGDAVTLKWEAAGEDGTKKSGSATFKKVDKPVAEPNTIYFDNSAARWQTPHIHYWGGVSQSSWPGEAMEKVTGDVWKYKVSEGTTGCLFNAGDGDATKTQDMVAVMGHIYDQNGDKGAYGDIPDDPTPVTPDAFVVYWNNSSANWSEVRVHFWGGESESTWPGEVMQAVPGEHAMFCYTVPKGTTGLVFNNGQGTQTGDYTASNNHIYDQSGDIGVHQSSVSEIEWGKEEPVYFNLQGVQVMNPDHGVFIVKRGAKVTKVVF